MKKLFFRTEYVWRFPSKTFTNPFHKNDCLEIYEIKITTVPDGLGLFISGSLRAKSNKYDDKLFYAGKWRTHKSQRKATGDIEKWLIKLQTAPNFKEYVHSKHENGQDFLYYERESRLPLSHQAFKLFLHVVEFLGLNCEFFPTPSISVEIVYRVSDDETIEYEDFLARKFYGAKIEKDE